MTKETVEFDGEKILISLYEKYKQQSWVLSNKDIEDKCNQWFGGGKFKNFKINLYKGRHKFGFNCGITFNEHQELDFVFDSDDREYTLHVCKLSLKKLFDKIKISDNKLVIIYGAISRKDIKISNEEKQFFNEFFEQCEKEAEIVFNQFKEKEKDDYEKKKNAVEAFKSDQLAILSGFDKDSNGEIDLIENDFNKLFYKNQKTVTEIDKNYIHQFVKISNFIKTKKHNTQKIYESIRDTSSQEELQERVGLLKNQVHSYELLVFHSINMIGALVSENLISFYEIYESFDKLGVFNSNWENEVSEKLTNIGEKLNDLLYSIYNMEQNIVSELSHLSYITQESFNDLNRSVTNQLKEVQSSINTNNLLTGIQAYQLYKINTNTKSLRN